MNSTYKNAGVNISESDRFVKFIKPLVKSTFNRQVISGIGNFGAFFQIPKGFKNPVFVASTDGVGTKLKIAIESDRNGTIGEDLVNHCVNDIAVCGADPLFFLDYMAFGKFSADTGIQIMSGLVRGCRNNHCSLIGGETAEMPGVYQHGDYDLAGTIVGVVEKNRIIDKKNVKTGDVLIGLSSNGLHTNGFSLVRKALLGKYKLNRYFDELGCTLEDELLKTHRSYLKIIKELRTKYSINSISHITGGGILGNTRRVVPGNLKIKINWNSWKRNPVFCLIQREGKISEPEMRKVFNLGIGLVVIVSRKDASSVSRFLKSKKEKHFIIGEITA